MLGAVNCNDCPGCPACNGDKKLAAAVCCAAALLSTAATGYLGVALATGASKVGVGTKVLEGISAVLTGVGALFCGVFAAGFYSDRNEENTNRQGAEAALLPPPIRTANID